MTISNHPYHLVEKSPWPIVASVSALLLTTGLVKWFHYFNPYLLLTGLLAMALTSTQWWRDVSREATLQGSHTLKVSSGMRVGMLLFIVSEFFMFFYFFWGFFHCSLNPTMELGGTLTTYLYLPFQSISNPSFKHCYSFSFRCNRAHHAITESFHTSAINGLTLTVVLGLYFSALQMMEYAEAPFTLADSMYGSTFFVATGFHGLHVIVGTTFLMACQARLLRAHFSKTRHVGLEATIWYWHFVDVVWLILYTSIYWCGS